MHEAGVAAARDLGNHVEAVTNLAVVCRAVAPVEVVFSGPVIDEPPARVAHSRLVTDEPGAREVVRQLAGAGATWVKTYTGLRPALVGAVVEEARQHGLRVAHRPGRTDAMAAAALGVSSVEHLALCLPKTPSTARPADILRVCGRAQLDEHVSRLTGAFARHGTAVVPLLHAWRRAAVLEEAVASRASNS